MANHFKTAQPIEYFRKFLEKDVRPDGRELGEIRPTVLNAGSISTAEGSALVKLGNTTVLCGIKAELASPKTEEAGIGFIVPNVELSPLCSSRFRAGPPSEQAQVLSQFVKDVLTNSNCVHKEDLCIVKGKLVWVLYCDMVCLDYDGNVVDACILSLVAALTNARLPVVRVDEETEKIETHDTETTPLVLHSCPVSTSFAIFDDHIIIVDPTIEEENLTTGVVTIVTAGERLCTVHKPGGSPLSEGQLQQCIERSFIRGKEIQPIIARSRLQRTASVPADR